jgi:hypothetical protein
VRPQQRQISNPEIEVEMGSAQKLAQNRTRKPSDRYRTFILIFYMYLVFENESARSDNSTVKICKIIAPSFRAFQAPLSPKG